MINTSQPIVNTLKNKIYGNGRGWVFTLNDFQGSGSPTALRRSLAALETEGFVRRLAHGIYDYPRQHPTLGELPPDINCVANALARKFQIRLQPAGAFAANQLGLSDQVPGRHIFLTDGANKVVRIPGTIIQFKKTTPKRMKVAGTISGLVFEALRSIGKDNVTPNILTRLQKRLAPDDRKRLILDLHFAPGWLSHVLKEWLEV